MTSTMENITENNFFRWPPVAQVSISIKNTSVSTISDEAGTFVLKNLKPGTYSIIASYTGFEPVEEIRTKLSDDIHI